MRFRTRTLRPEDMEECFELFARRPNVVNRYASLRHRRRAIETLKSLVTRTSVTTGMVETPDLARGQRILTFGLSAFVRRDWLHHYLRDPFPSIGAWVIDRCMESADAGILLSDAEVARANSHEGLCALTICLAWAPERVPAEDLFQFRQEGIRCFGEAHQGYRLAEIVSECFRGPESDLFLSSGSWSERSDFEAFFHRQPNSRPHHPTVLIGLTKEEAAAVVRAAAVTTSLFVWREVRYCFRPEQQRLLLLAMEHANDNSLAQALAITDHAVGRRWTRIFKRVEALQPADDPVFPPGCEPAGKRARLLLRLTREMHELRPHDCQRKLQGAHKRKP